MPIVVNSNVAATQASFNLSKSNDALRKAFPGYRLEIVSTLLLTMQAD